MEQKNPALFKATEWITWFGCVSMAISSGLIFLYSNFETKAEADRLHVDRKAEYDKYRIGIEDRLTRIENKLDILILKTR